MPSQLNVDHISPSSSNILDINGVNIEGGNNTVYLGDSNNIPSSVRSVIVGVGAAGSITGSDNVAIGKNAMLNGSTSFASVAIGSNAGVNLTTGNSNVIIGSNAGNNITTGFSNVCIGQLAGSTLGANSTTNTFIGDYAGGYISLPITGVGNTCIGHNSSPSSATANLEFTLGSNVSVLRCQQTSITSLSDERDKKNIKDLSAGLEFVEALRPVEFTWDDRDERGRHDVADFGFIAQDLKKAQEDAEKAEVLKLVYEENPEKLEASYGKLIPILVKAIQELSAEVKELKNK